MTMDGYLKAKVEHMEKDLGEVKTALNATSLKVEGLSHTVARAMGFVSAVVFLAQLMNIYMHYLRLKGGIQ